MNQNRHEHNQQSQLEQLANHIGIPFSYLQNQQVWSNYVVPAVVTNFSDGEIVASFRPNKANAETLRLAQDEVINNFFENPQHSKFAKELRLLSESKNEELYPIALEIVVRTARQYAQKLAEGKLITDLRPNVTINGNLLGFDHNIVPLTQKPERVIDFGPGIIGASHIEQQLQDLYYLGQTPYQYIGLSKGPFINVFLLEYYQTRLNDPQLFNAIITNQYFIGRVDGIAAATTEFSRAQKENTGTTECVDLIIASGVMEAEQEELTTGIQNAHKLLRPGGSLLIRAPKTKRTENTLSANEMCGIAFNSGFSQEKAQFFDVVTGTFISGRKESLSAVLTK